MAHTTVVDEKFAESYVKRIYDPEGSFSYQKAKQIARDVKKELKGDMLTVIVAWLVYAPVYLRPPNANIQDELEVKFGETIADYVMRLQPNYSSHKLPGIKEFELRVEGYCADPVLRKVALAMFLNNIAFTPIEAWKPEWLEAYKSACFKLSKAVLNSAIDGD